MRFTSSRLALLAAFATTLATSLAVLPQAAFASGADGMMENPFVPENHVPFPEMPAYAAGRIGVLQGDWWRLHHVLAWRALHGQTLTPAQYAALNQQRWQVGEPQMGYGYFWSDTENGVEAWKKVRNTVQPPLSEKTRIDPSKSTPSYVTYVNCHADAFTTAARTLTDRKQRGDAPALQAWVAGQDAVFANCGETPTRNANGQMQPAGVIWPPALPAKAPLWLQQDHAYQTAAALFYAGQFDHAREAFKAIGRDKASPWQPLGDYLASRCLIRAATLMPVADGSTDKIAPAGRNLLLTARKELQAQVVSYPPAARLVGWIEARLNPTERVLELGRQLATGPLDTAARRQGLTDYLWLLDGQAETGPMALSLSPDPMTSWIGLVQSPVDDDKQRASTLQSARGRFEKTGDLAWLLPLLMQTRTLADLQPAELKAVQAVPTTSPAWQTLNFHLARLQLDAGQGVAADALADRALAGQAGALSISGRNQWLRLKLVSARTLDAFLAAAARTPAPDAETATPIPDEVKPAAAASAPVAPFIPEANGVDTDFPRRLYHYMPLALLKQMHARKDLPASIRGQLGESIFTRALVLEDWPTALGLIDEMASSRATTRHLYDRLRNAKTLEAQRVAATLLLVNTPELSPRAVQPGGQSLYWGCRDYGGPWDVDQLGMLAPQFLSPAQLQQARREQERLTALPIRTEWLADRLLPWAASNQADAEAPKALHFLVASTRMECPGGPAQERRAGTPEPTHSRDAFRLLHKRWPGSEWAAKTKYWF
ncbi:hypothetical protein [Ideonella margarita]|uniref:Secreted protein n=1 Tax=Ideonella margarita TaxID=2984191 RepID=A0ABU9C494_9BURK